MATTIVLVPFVVMASAMAVVNVKDSYSYSYSVNAEATGDFKSHQETRRGGLVQGSYSVLEPGGILRTVEYTADPIRGFRAVVHRRPLTTENNTISSTSSVKFTSATEMSQSTTERSASTSQKLPSTIEKLPSTSESSPSMSEWSPSTSEWSPSTSEWSPSTSERSPSTSERSPSTTKLAESTYAPDNLGHFAAAMFGTRRKKLHSRQQ